MGVHHELLEESSSCSRSRKSECSPPLRRLRRDVDDYQCAYEMGARRERHRDQAAHRERHQHSLCPRGRQGTPRCRGSESRGCSRRRVPNWYRVSALIQSQHCGCERVPARLVPTVCGLGDAVQADQAAAGLVPNQVVQDQPGEREEWSLGAVMRSDRRARRGAAMRRGSRPGCGSSRREGDRG